jgi:hypothetical protein
MVYSVNSVVADMLILSEFLSGKGYYRYRLRCTICGAEREVDARGFRRGVGQKHINTCGIGNRRYPAFYSAWDGSTQRITNPNSAEYYHYGGRGLKHDFLSYLDFEKECLESWFDHTEKFGQANTWLDRIDVDEGYVSGNLRWLTKAESNENVTRTRPFFAAHKDGEQWLAKNASKFAKKYSLDGSTVTKCLHGERWTHKKWHFRFLPEVTVNRLLYPYKTSLRRLLITGGREKVRKIIKQEYLCFAPDFDIDTAIDTIVKVALLRKLSDGILLSEKKD